MYPGSRQILGKPVGAVVAATKVIRVLHEATRPLSASEVARVADLHRGTAYNILRTLQAEGFVSYDEDTKTFWLSLRLLELAHGVLHKSGLMEVSRPLLHGIASQHNVTVYLARIIGASRSMLIDWVGMGYQTDVYLTVGRQYFPLLGAPGVLLAAFSAASKEILLAENEKARWFRRPSLKQLTDRVELAGQTGISIDSGDLHAGLTQISVPIRFSENELVMILTGAGRSDELDEQRITALSRDMTAVGHRISEALWMARLS